MTRTKKLIAGLLAALLMLAVLPVASFAAEVAYQANEAKELAKLDEAWKPIEAVEAEMKEMKASPAEVAAAAYKAALNNPLVDEGSLVWEKDEQFAFTVNGMHCVYYYRARNTTPAANVDEKLLNIIETSEKGANCGAAGAVDVLLVGPYYGQDSSFTDQYKTEATSIANATGGTRTMLSGTSATGPAIASNYTNKGVVIYDSHGTQSGTSSYLCLTTNSGITTTDYNNGWAVSSGSAAFIDGRYIQNHVSGTLSNCFVWMAICEGMKKAGKGTTGTALLAAGAGGVYGYSQSVSFTGDYQYEATFWTQMKNGKTVAQAIATMKSTHGNWDPAYSSSSGAAWPIVMSAVDAFPSNPDGTQTVNCDWELFGSTTSYTVTATSNNTNYGTVSVNGYTITASPKTGYYAAGYTVTSGTATVAQNGNVFTVTPSSDCTVRINFAAKTQYTINYVASGTAQGSVTAYSGDSITLPATAAVNPDGWTFIGWVANQVAETTNKPTYYAPGASYNVTGNATFYALYDRLEGEGGDTVYQQTSDLEVGGKYAITAGNYAVSNTIYNTSNNHYVSSQSVTINDSTNTLTVASSVNINSILYEVESGNSSAGWVFKNVANGKYLTLGSDEYLIVGDTALAWLWTGSDLNNQIDSEGYYYLARSSNSTYFTTSKQTNGTIVLYKEVTLGTYYYTTDPVAQTPTYTVTFKDWDGTVLSTQTVEQGASATAPANPTRTGYTFTGWDVAFTNVQSDLVVTAQYQINSYTLTINYVYANGGTAANTVTRTFNYGASYSIASPTLTGYTASQTTVAGTMPANNVTVTVTYTPNNYTLTINYVYAEGGNAAPTYTGTYAYGASYSVTSPVIEGYTASQAVVSGTMGASNVTVTVTYTAEDVPPVEPDLLGDVNCDGVVNMADLSALCAYVLGKADLTPQGIANADANGDGNVNAMDLPFIYQLTLNS